MKAVILAGGLGTRIAEESDYKPKPMVEVGNRPLLWHIMKTYSHYGVNDFIICLGYKGYIIKEYFENYQNHTSDIKISLKTGKTKILNSHSEDWNVTLLDTGLETMTGGRLKRIAPYLGNETFFLTYGDGLSDINISDELEFHNQNKKLVTVSAVQPPGRFGVLNINKKNIVSSFEEKPKDEIGWINGGFFIVEPAALKYINNDLTSWESDPLINIAKDNQLAAYKHNGFWMPCDTLRDKRELQKMWMDNNAPWKIWKN
mgnify:CR=1 FL=1